MHICYYDSPIGILRISETDGKITELCLSGETAGNDFARRSGGTAAAVRGSSETVHAEILQTICAQLNEYFAGTRRRFDVPIAYRGTPFQERVWRALLTIPYGETRSYEDIAIQIGSPKAVRAVGQANNRNPLMILVPCHRVIHKNGDISGFACGIEPKRYLLDLEAGRIDKISYKKQRTRERKNGKITMIAHESIDVERKDTNERYQQ